MRVIRPARRDDLPALLQLAEESGPGFTSLPVDERILSARLKAAELAFNKRRKPKPGDKYILMLEETATGEVLGTSGVKTSVGLDKPFFNYRILGQAQSSVAAGRRFDMDVLVLVNDYAGCTEVGSLFLSARARGGGAGRLLAQSRYLLMAAAPERFSDIVISELRGVVSPEGDAPFWDHLGRKFFRMSFAEADHLSAVTDNQFILDLMPRYPVYVDLLPPEAQAVIGECHKDGQGARRLLDWEGFHFDGVVDIFDGGPLVSCPREQVRTVRESRRYRLEAGPVENGRRALVSSDRLPDFRVVSTDVERFGRRLRIAPEALDALNLKSEDMARVWMSHDS